MNNSKIEHNKSLILYGIILGVYIALRYVAWRNTFLLEDSDSIGYLYQIKVFLTFSLEGISSLGPDVTPFYPLWGALWSLPGWSVETGARVCSLFFSTQLFIAIVLIGRRFLSRLEIVVGLLIVAFNPVLISLSYAVLTEPSYIAICYIGLWLFLTQYKNPQLWQAGLLGIIFSLSFLSRTEGFLYLIVIPAIQGIHFLFYNQQKYSINRFISWCFIYILSFSILAIPQIWLVSNKMGHLAINGRQVWTYVLQEPDGKSYDEKIYGLDYSPQQINLSYIQRHNEVSKITVATISIKGIFKTMLTNLKELYQNKLWILIGPAGLLFFGVGLFVLYKSKRRFELFLILAFISTALVAPLIHNVVIRHIAVIAPIIILVEGIGIAYLVRHIAAAMTYDPNDSVSKISFALLFLALIAGQSIKPLKRIYIYPVRYNNEYNNALISKAAAIISEVSKTGKIENPRIVDRKMYLPFYSGMDAAPLPYTDYEGLVKYCSLNKVNFLFLRYNLIDKYPFVSRFHNKFKIDDFQLLYSERDSYGLNELYRVRTVIN